MLRDIRLTRSRTGAIIASIDGRRVYGCGETPDYAVALLDLSKAISSAAWLSGRSSADETADPSSVLYREPV